MRHRHGREEISGAVHQADGDEHVPRRAAGEWLAHREQNHDAPHDVCERRRLIQEEIDSEDSLLWMDASDVNTLLTGLPMNLGKKALFRKVLSHKRKAGDAKDVVRARKMRAIASAYPQQNAMDEVSGQSVSLRT